MERWLLFRKGAMCGELPKVQSGLSRTHTSVTLEFLLLLCRKFEELSLPKFSISTDYGLQDILPQLGIREVFSTQADLSGITGAKNLRVSQVYQ